MLTKVVVLLLGMLGYLASSVGAQTLTPAQLQTLKTDITVTNAAEFAALLAIPDYPGIAAAYNLNAAPAFHVWKTSVPPEVYTGVNSMVWTEVDGLSTGKARIFEWLTGGLIRSFDPSDDAVRAGILEAFPTATENQLIALSKRQARRVEKLYANTSGGNGALATPAKLVFEGTINHTIVSQAVNLP